MKKFLNEIEDDILAILLIAMTILAFVNVIARYVFLASLPWIEELNRLGLVIISYAGAACALKNHAHLGLTIITDHLPAKAKKIVNIFGALCGVFFCFIGTYYGLILTINEKAQNVRTQGMQWPQWLFDLALPVGCIILGIRFIQWAVLIIMNKDFKPAETIEELMNEELTDNKKEVTEK